MSISKSHDGALCSLWVWYIHSIHVPLLHIGNAVVRYTVMLLPSHLSIKYWGIFVKNTKAVMEPFVNKYCIYIKRIISQNYRLLNIYKLVRIISTSESKACKNMYGFGYSSHVRSSCYKRFQIFILVQFYYLDTLLAFYLQNHVTWRIFFIEKSHIPRPMASSSVDK